MLYQQHSISELVPALVEGFVFAHLVFVSSVSILAPRLMQTQRFCRRTLALAILPALLAFMCEGFNPLLICVVLVMTHCPSPQDTAVSIVIILLSVSGIHMPDRCSCVCLSGALALTLTSDCWLLALCSKRSAQSGN